MTLVVFIKQRKSSIYVRAKAMMIRQCANGAKAAQLLLTMQVCKSKEKPIDDEYAGFASVVSTGTP
jgi:hypothetical protein